ncbi:hypothetical protein DM01DRAFT_1339336 [Hesseltinella vesiculosa]|uniref:Uncharacterized protein n=1 Tax=Hesseltinella vesiculosa TaxID=101127 RepID=A0A1X2G8L0_9FUNG|nr:hypothetical protein DM01DRAFT_1339336 [Hesseltinella vesiculosa]
MSLKVTIASKFAKRVGPEPASASPKNSSSTPKQVKSILKEAPKKPVIKDALVGQVSYFTAHA